MTDIRRGGDLRISEGLFLEKQELNRLKQFLGDRGFKNQLLINSYEFGLVQFKDGGIPGSIYPTNGQVVPGATNSTVRVTPLIAIDDQGNFISSPDVDNISGAVDNDAPSLEVPNDNQWYWLKISYTSVVEEEGVFSIDQNGNLVGTSAKLMDVLRGMPNSESVIRFTNSSTNTLEYRVVKVIDDHNAVIQGDFTPESGLKIAVVGSFTPGFVPNSADKDIFRYNGCSFEFIPEQSFNTAPSKEDGKEFYLARVKRDGANVDIQDKRREFWRTKVDNILTSIDQSLNPLIGVERIRFQHLLQRRVNNLLELSWGFRVTSWSLQEGSTVIFLNSGVGGRYKSVGDIEASDFNGWLLYIPSKNVTYNIINTSGGSGGQGAVSLESVNVDDFSDDGGDTFIDEELFIAPRCESVEIKLTPKDGNRNDLTTLRKVFPNFTPIAKMEVPQFNIKELSEYIIEYRYKQFQTFNEFIQIPNDTDFGYYTEKAFDRDGKIRSIVNSNDYSTNFSEGYIKHFIDYLEVERPEKFFTELGDLKGVDTYEIPTSGRTDYNVGDHAIHQRIVDISSNPIITDDIFFNLQDPSTLVDGNIFEFYIGAKLNMPSESSASDIYFCTNYVDETDFEEIYRLGRYDIFALNAKDNTNRDGLKLKFTVINGQWEFDVIRPRNIWKNRGNDITIENQWSGNIFLFESADGDVYISGQFQWGDTSPPGSTADIFRVNLNVSSPFSFSSLHRIIAIPEDPNDPILKIRTITSGSYVGFRVVNPNDVVQNMVYWVDGYYKRDRIIAKPNPD